MDTFLPTDQQAQADVAPSAVLDDQPQGQIDQTPQDAAPPEEAPSDPAAELARLQAERDRIQAERDQERQQRQEAQQRISAYERQVADNMARQIQQAKADLHAALPSMDPDEAVQATIKLYEAENQLLRQGIQQVTQQTHQERVAAFAQHIAKESGLSDADARQLLLTPGAYQDPNVMVQTAQLLKQNKETQSAETKRLQQQIDQLQRQIAANGIKPAWQTGGANGGAPSADAYNPKSPDYDAAAHYLALTRR